MADRRFGWQRAAPGVCEELLCPAEYGGSGGGMRQHWRSHRPLRGLCSPHRQAEVLRFILAKTRASNSPAISRNRPPKIFPEIQKIAKTFC